MSDAAVASAATSLLNRQDANMAAVKQALKSEQQVADLVSQVTGTPNTLSSGDQPLNASGRGQIVNTFA